MHTKTGGGFFIATLKTAHILAEYKRLDTSVNSDQIDD